jgi:microcystin degradation protein MlrC
MPRRKIMIASMMQETNTFPPVPTPLESFRPLSGDAAIAGFKDTNTQVGGFLDVAQRKGAEVAVPLTAGARPSGYDRHRRLRRLRVRLIAQNPVR